LRKACALEGEYAYLNFPEDFPPAVATREGKKAERQEQKEIRAATPPKSEARNTKSETNAKALDLNLSNGRSETAFGV
jgi:hypothetical protein